jgi:hypothetical protein
MDVSLDLGDTETYRRECRVASWEEVPGTGLAAYEKEQTEAVENFEGMMEIRGARVLNSMLVDMDHFEMGVSVVSAEDMKGRPQVDPEKSKATQNLHDTGHVGHADRPRLLKHSVEFQANLVTFRGADEEEAFDVDVDVGDVDCVLEMTVQGKEGEDDAD